MKLRGTDERSLDKALRRVAKHGEKVAELRHQQAAAAAALAQRGVSDASLRSLTASESTAVAAAAARSRLFVDRQLSDYAAVTPVANCGRVVPLGGGGQAAGGGPHTLLWHARHAEAPCMLKRVACTTAADRSQLQQALLALRRLQHPGVARLQAVFFDATHAHLQYQVRVREREKERERERERV